MNTPHIHCLDDEFVRLGLEPYVLQLELDGLTIVPPEVTGVAPDLISEAVDVLLADAERITGTTFSVDGGPTDELEWPAPPFGLHLSDVKAAGDIGEVTQFQLQSLATRHRVFRDLVVNPVAVALVQHTMGTQPRLSSSNAFIKWRGEFGYGTNLGLHSDQAAMPMPWGTTALNANATWCLTDYSKDDGALAFVPGSHREFGKPPADSHLRAVAAEAARGSLIVFHGATWHGAYPRINPGMRLTLANYFRHPAVLPQEDLRGGFDAQLAQDCSDPALLRQILSLEDLGPYAVSDNSERVKFGLGWLPHVKKAS